ncbi:hypothetical protein E4T80_09735 [Muribacter muris]|uniref:Uncharacterized protein n=1 Tax=Muribacter muris TaxID=67855 RepID=A0A4Y9JS77_9PAST|nr:hypothetical protein [Muribacter muris]MBF0785738.1 hypothetical protein [Muribacter muris]MBF0828290.1 hypothetical protein [Muribacter muris]TFV08561.1 hypothetical protein E4T80_09735 [Muribacter muris]
MQTQNDDDVRIVPTEHKFKLTFSCQIDDEVLVNKTVEFSDSRTYMIKHQAAEIIKQLEMLKLNNELDEVFDFKGISSAGIR